MAAAEPTLLYDPDEHHAAPIEISWITRKGFASNPRWVFIRCCGQVGAPKGGVIRTRSPCVPKAPETMHSGQVALCRATRAQVTKHRGTLPIAEWQCCGEAALSTWDEAWDVTDSMGLPRRERRIPPGVFAPGCGRWDASIATHGASVAPGGAVARLARPLASKRRSARSPRSGGISSGLEQVSLGPITVSVADVLPTQRFVNLTTFTTPDGPKKVFDVMIDLIDRDSAGFPYTLKAAPRWPPIRVARRDQLEPGPLYGAAADAPEGADDIYSIDNRRLFMLKVLGVSTVEAEEILWMHEFDSKLKQGRPPAADRHLHCRTDDDGVRRARRRLDAMIQSRLLDAKLDADEAALKQQLKELKRRGARLLEQLAQVRAERERVAEARAVEDDR